MQTNIYPSSFLYNDAVLVKRYFNRFKPDNTDVSKEETLPSLSGLLKRISSQNCVFVLVWDIVKDRFVFAADERKVVGYDTSLYLADNGIQFTLSNMHPDFFPVNFMMQNTALDYLIKYNGTELNKIIISCDGRYRRSNGDYFHFLQQVVCIESDSNSNPLLFLGYIHDVSHLKKENTANLIITTPDEVLLWNYNTYDKRLDPVHPLSKQEKKVLSYLAKGKHSKEIAAELFNSTSTIDTHRRNLLKKTNCLDTSGMITYAKLVGLLCIIGIFYWVFFTSSLYFHFAHAVSGILLFIHFKLISGLHLYRSLLLILIPKVSRIKSS